MELLKKEPSRPWTSGLGAGRRLFRAWAGSRVHGCLTSRPPATAKPEQEDEDFPRGDLGPLHAVSPSRPACHPLPTADSRHSGASRTWLPHSVPTGPRGWSELVLRASLQTTGHPTDGCWGSASQHRAGPRHMTESCESPQGTQPAFHKKPLPIQGCWEMRGWASLVYKIISRGSHMNFLL